MIQGRRRNLQGKEPQKQWPRPGNNVCGLRFLMSYIFYLWEESFLLLHMRGIITTVYLLMKWKPLQFIHIENPIEHCIKCFYSLCQYWTMYASQNYEDLKILTWRSRHGKKQNKKQNKKQKNKHENCTVWLAFEYMCKIQFKSKSPEKPDRWNILTHFLIFGKYSFLLRLFPKKGGDLIIEVIIILSSLNHHLQGKFHWACLKIKNMEISNTSFSALVCCVLWSKTRFVQL